MSSKSTKNKSPAAVTKDRVTRLNVNVDSAKYKKLKLRALQNDIEITELVNGWIDDYIKPKKTK